MNILLGVVDLLYDSTGLKVHSKNRAAAASSNSNILKCHHAVLRSAQQAGQRVAAIGIAVKQSGQSFLPGSFFLILLAIFTIKNITIAMSTKFTRSLRKAP